MFWLRSILLRRRKILMPLMKMWTKTRISILRRLRILRPSPRNESQDLATSARYWFAFFLYFRRRNILIRFFLFFQEGHQDLATLQHLDMLLHQNISPLLSKFELTVPPFFDLVVVNRTFWGKMYPYSELFKTMNLKCVCIYLLKIKTYF